MRTTLAFTILMAASLVLQSTDSVAKEDKQAEQERLAKIALAERKSQQESRRAEIERLAKEADAEKSRQEMAEKAEAQRIARQEREQELERLRQEREQQCVILPVMTDAQIAKCKEVWR